MTLPPDSPITPVTACTMPGRSGQDRVTTSCAFSVMGASLVRFIPTNEAGAGFAGDATGLWGGAIAGRGEVVALREGWSPGRARLPFHASFTRTARAHRLSRGISARWVAALTLGLVAPGHPHRALLSQSTLQNCNTRNPPTHPLDTIADLDSSAEPHP